MERILGNIHPQTEKKDIVKYDFINFKLNPLRDRGNTDLCSIPRVVVTPDESAAPSYLEIKKTINQSEYYVYEPVKGNYNICEVR